MKKDYVISIGVFLLTALLIFFVTRDFFKEFYALYKKHFDGKIFQIPSNLCSWNLDF